MWLKQSEYLRSLWLQPWTNIIKYVDGVNWKYQMIFVGNNIVKTGNKSECDIQRVVSQIKNAY